MVLRQLWKGIREKIRGPVPQMTRREIRVIERALRPSDVMLEWGCGGSTYRFSRLVRDYYSIEHDPQWFHRMQQVVRKAGRDNVHMALVRPNVPEGGTPNYARSSAERYAQFRDYIEHVDELGVARFDRVLIDGRSRPECALRVLPFLAPDSRVFIHDFYNTRYDRAEYAPVLDRYEVVESVETGRSLVVLRPR